MAAFHLWEVLVLCFSGTNNRSESISPEFFFLTFKNQSFVHMSRELYSYLEDY